MEYLPTPSPRPVNGALGFNESTAFFFQPPFGKQIKYVKLSLYIFLEY